MPTEKIQIELNNRWSRKKRLGVATGVAGIILVSALIIGTGIYWLGVNLKIFTPFNLWAEVNKRAQSDPALVAAFNQALNAPTCVNRSLGYSYRYQDPLVVTMIEGQEACSEVTYPLNASLSAYLKIQGHNWPAGEEVDRLTALLSDVVTDTFPHEIYPGTIITGQSGEMPVSIVVLATDKQVSWSFTSWPRETNSQPVMMELVRSFNL